MNLMMAILAALTRVGPMTVTNWGTSIGASPVSSASRAITVPSGNPGTLKWSIITNSGTLQYSKNGGAFATVTHNATITVANGDTIQFKLTGAGTDCLMDIIDNTFSTTIGTWEATAS